MAEEACCIGELPLSFLTILPECKAAYDVAVVVGSASELSGEEFNWHAAASLVRCPMRNNRGVIRIRRLVLVRNGGLLACGKRIDRGIVIQIIARLLLRIMNVRLKL